MPEELKGKPEESFKGPQKKAETLPDEKEGGNLGSLASPEGVLMMFAALLLDCIGVFLLIFGLDDFGVTDIIGIFLIGGWMYSRSGFIAMPKGAEKKAKGWLRKLFRGKWKRYLTPILGEAIPYFGGIALCWTLAVYYELTD